MIGACVAWLALALPTAAAQDEGTVDRLVVVAEGGSVGDEALLWAALAGVTAHLDEVTGTPGNTVRTDAQRAAGGRGRERAPASGQILHPAGGGAVDHPRLRRGRARRRACRSMISWWAWAVGR